MVEILAVFLLRLKLVELNFLVSFNTDDQSKTDVTYTVTLQHINPSHQDEPFQSIKPQVWPKLYRRGKKLGRKRAKAR